MADEAAITLPFLVCDAQPGSNISAAPSLPALAGYASDYGLDGTAELTLLPLELTASVIDGPGGSASISLPLFTLAASMGAFAEIELPAFVLSAQSTESPGWVGSPILPMFTLSAEAFTFRDGSASISLPGLNLAASVVSGAYAEADLHLPLLKVSASGASGANGIASLSLPVFVLDTLVGPNIVGTAAIDLPLLWVDAHGYTTPADVWRTWVMNLDNEALTEYTGLKFTSYINFNGSVYATGPGGVYRLDTTDNDNGVGIPASWVTGNYNFEDSHQKRIPRMYVEGKQTGDIRITTSVSIGGTRGYGLYYDGVDSIRTRRVPIGRGPRSVYWTFGGNNVGGSYFEISRILIHPEIMRRRVF